MPGRHQPVCRFLHQAGRRPQSSSPPGQQHRQLRPRLRNAFVVDFVPVAVSCRIDATVVRSRFDQHVSSSSSILNDSRCLSSSPSAIVINNDDNLLYNATGYSEMSRRSLHLRRSVRLEAEFDNGGHVESSSALTQKPFFTDLAYLLSMLFHRKDGVDNPPVSCGDLDVPLRTVTFPHSHSRYTTAPAQRRDHRLIPRGSACSRP